MYDRIRPSLCAHRNVYIRSFISYVTSYTYLDGNLIVEDHFKDNKKRLHIYDGGIINPKYFQEHIDKSIVCKELPYIKCKRKPNGNLTLHMLSYIKLLQYFLEQKIVTNKK